MLIRASVVIVVLAWYHSVANADVIVDPESGAFTGRSWSADSTLSQTIATADDPAAWSGAQGAGGSPLSWDGAGFFGESNAGFDGLSDMGAALPLTVTATPDFVTLTYLEDVALTRVARSSSVFEPGALFVLALGASVLTLVAIWRPSHLTTTSHGG